jgi:hypothetical protein
MRQSASLFLGRKLFIFNIRLKNFLYNLVMVLYRSGLFKKSMVYISDLFLPNNIIFSKDVHLYNISK